MIRTSSAVGLDPLPSSSTLDRQGFEYTLPESLSDMKKPDASLTLLSPRSSLDLLVDDKTINDLYHVELKSTKQVSSRCPREPSGLKPAPTPDAASSDGVPSQLSPWPR